MRICSYCRSACEATPGLDLHGHCGCCCQWVFCDQVGRYSLLRGLFRIYRCVGAGQAWRALVAAVKGA